MFRRKAEEKEKEEAALWSVEGVCLGKWVDDDAKVFATRRSPDTSCRADPCV